MPGLRRPPVTRGEQREDHVNVPGLRRPPVTRGELPAAVEQRIAHLRLDGLDYLQISDRLNADRVPTPRGRKWNRHLVRVRLPVARASARRARGRPRAGARADPRAPRAGRALPGDR